MLRRDARFFAVIAAGTAAVDRPRGGHARRPTPTCSTCPSSVAGERSARDADGRRRRSPGTIACMVVGDSMSWSVWVGLDEWGKTHGVQFGRYSALGCGVGGPGTLELPRASCARRSPTARSGSATWRKAVRVFRPGHGARRRRPRRHLAPPLPRRASSAASATRCTTPRLTRRSARWRARSRRPGRSCGGSRSPTSTSRSPPAAPAQPPFVENDPKRIDELNALVAAALADVPGRVDGRPRRATCRAVPAVSSIRRSVPTVRTSARSGTAEVARWLGPQLAAVTIRTEVPASHRARCAGREDRRASWWSACSSPCTSTYWVDRRRHRDRGAADLVAAARPASAARRPVRLGRAAPHPAAAVQPVRRRASSGGARSSAAVTYQGALPRVRTDARRSRCGRCSSSSAARSSRRRSGRSSSRSTPGCSATRTPSPTSCRSRPRSCVAGLCCARYVRTRRTAVLVGFVRRGHVRDASRARCSTRCWLLVVIAIVLIVARPDAAGWRAVVGVCAIPVVLVGGWMVKNQVLFDEPYAEQLDARRATSHAA